MMAKRVKIPASLFDQLPLSYKSQTTSYQKLFDLVIHHMGQDDEMDDAFVKRIMPVIEGSLYLGVRTFHQEMEIIEDIFLEYTAMAKAILSEEFFLEDLIAIENQYKLFNYDLQGDE